jgi:hypothetical protein
MSALEQQHERWTEARGRLMGEPIAPPPAPRKRKPGRPKGATVPDMDLYGDAFRWKQIAYEVASKHGLTLPELFARRRWQNIVIARQELFYRLSKETSMSLPAMGRMCGGYDHTTALHSIRKHEQRMKEAANG